jgi:hypothetical protein
MYHVYHLAKFEERGKRRTSMFSGDWLEILVACPRTGEVIHTGKGKMRGEPFREDDRHFEIDCRHCGDGLHEFEANELFFDKSATMPFLVPSRRGNNGMNASYSQAGRKA